MAEISIVKISALPVAEQIGDEDLLALAQDGATKALAYGTIKDDISEELAPDATLSEAGKAADAKAVGDALALKSDVTAVTAEVERIDSAIATKADAAATTAALATKANINDVNAALALKADTATVDAALMLKADKTELTAGLATKQNVLTFDSTPTENSTNPVTSGGVWEAIQTDKTLAVEDKAADAKATGNTIAELKSALEEDRTLNSIKKESIGVTTGVGTGPVANTRRWFLPDVIPAGAIIKDTNYFCASATSGTVDIELWEKTGDALSRVLVVTQTPTASTWNNASLNYNADKEVMISFKPSSGSIRSDSLATGKVTFAAEDLTSETLSYSALAPFQNLQICANVNYLMKSDNIFVVAADGNGDYTSFSQALITVFANYPNATIIVNPGTYDIYQEMMDIYGSDYWDSITTSQADQKRNLFGLPFGNGMKIHGNSGAIIVMDNISSNNTVKTWFSVLHGEDDPNSKYQGAEVKNLVINCRNIRYAVHIDFGSELNSGEYLVESCKMSLDNSQNDQRTNAYVLGMGGGAYTTYKFINNYLTPVFPPNTRDHAGVYFHNSGNANAKNRCNIEFNYIGNAGTIRVDAYGTSQNKCLAMITGNSIGEDVMVVNTDDNLEVIEWNNSVRT